MGQEFFGEFKAWFVLQICFRESPRWCAQKELWIPAKRSFCYEGNFGQCPYAKPLNPKNPKP